MTEEPSANDKVISSISKISSSKEAKEKKLPNPTIQKKATDLEVIAVFTAIFLIFSASIMVITLTKNQAMTLLSTKISPILNFRILTILMVKIKI